MCVVSLCFCCWERLRRAVECIDGMLRCVEKGVEAGMLSCRRYLYARVLACVSLSGARKYVLERCFYCYGITGVFFVV